MFEVFSSFTTIISFLAIVIEIQYGNRIPRFRGQKEVAAGIFLGLTALNIKRPWCVCVFVFVFFCLGGRGLFMLLNI